jgi:hypothetical protein
MKCPGCGNSDAYMGFASIDCPNSSCRHYQGSSTLATPAAVPVAPAPVSSTPTATAVAPSQGSTGSATIAANPALAVDIITQTPKKSTVELTFVARGDPGYPNKTVEFLWILPGQATAVICTLSSRNTYYVAGIDADGATTYTTQWRCTLDGVQPTDAFTISWRIF